MEHGRPGSLPGAIEEREEPVIEEVQEVPQRAAHQRVVAKVSFQRVVVGATLEQIVAQSAAQRVSIWAAVQQGLLVQPDMQVVGGGSHGNTLQWYVDRVAGPLPRPWVLWLPLWCWRSLMLLWALWLASRLLRWCPWAWERFGVDGLWRRRPSRAEPAVAPQDGE